MRINSENIEEIIFEYHEGNLAEEQKADLMDFLHKHPGYEREFVLWAKTYYHTDSVLPDYGHNERFLRKVIPPYLKPLALFSGILVVVGVSFFLFQTWAPSSRQEEMPQVPTLLPANKQPVNEAIEQAASSKRKAVLRPKEELTIQQNTKSLNVYMDSVGSENEENLHSTEATNVEMMDSVLTAPSVLEQLEEPAEERSKKVHPVVEKTKKNKQAKRKLNLSPTPNILPFNSDF